MGGGEYGSRLQRRGDEKGVGIGKGQGGLKMGREGWIWKGGVDMGREGWR